MNKKIRTIIGIISSLILCIFGIYRLMQVYPEGIVVPMILAFGGFVGFIGGIFELKKIYTTSNS